MFGSVPEHDEERGEVQASFFLFTLSFSLSLSFSGLTGESRLINKQINHLDYPVKPGNDKEV